MGLTCITNNLKRACYWKETSDFITYYNMLRFLLLIPGLIIIKCQEKLYMDFS